MGMRFTDLLPRFANKFSDRLADVYLPSEDQRIDEQAQGVFHPRVMPARYRCPQHDILLVTVNPQQQVIAAQQYRVQADVQRGGQRPQLGTGRRIQLEGDIVATVIQLQWAHMVRRQVERLMVRQLPMPVGQLLVQRGTLQVLALPQCKFPVLHRRGREFMAGLSGEHAVIVQQLF
ncbi:Uncharacterised protein [Serratia fonticola]|nr:Uncharacterised protein [Serratia fonticola]